jgi:hypothetical protein
MAGGGCMDHPYTVTVMIQQGCTNRGRLNLIRWLLICVGPRYITCVTPQALRILRSLIDFDEICVFLWYGITECFNIRRRSSCLCASRTSCGIQELNADEAHEALPILLCAHARRLTWRETSLLACVISCMFLSDFNRVPSKHGLWCTWLRPWIYHYQTPEGAACAILSEFGFVTINSVVMKYVFPKRIFLNAW